LWAEFFNSATTPAKRQAIADADGNTISFSHDSGGRVSALTDDAGRSVSLVYGSNGLVASVRDPLGRTTSYGYDTADNLTSATDPLGHAWTFGYDANHLMMSMTDPNGGVVTNAFDFEGRVSAQADPLGRTTSFAYAGDAFAATGGSTVIANPAGDVTLEEYASGALTSILSVRRAVAHRVWRSRSLSAAATSLNSGSKNGHA
jgi:YD repeat-containing protein